MVDAPAPEWFAYEGRKLAYRSYGEEPRVTVLVHGVLLNQRMHEPLGRGLAEELPNARLVEASSLLEPRLAPERLTAEIADFLDECWRPRPAQRARARARKR